MNAKQSIAYITLFLLFLCKSGFVDATTHSTSNDWPMFRGNQQQLGVCESTLPDDLEVLWKFKTGGPIVNSAIVSGGTVFIASGDGFIYALDIHNGEKIWSHQTEGPIEASPMVLNDSLFIGSTDGFLYSIDVRNGSLNWKFETTDKIVGSANWAKPPDENKPIVLFGSYDGRLYALDAESGKERWRYESESYINSSPVVYNDKAVVGGCDACIHCVSLLNGKSISVFDVEAYIAATIAFDGERAYVGHYGNKFVCVDVPKQEILWEYKDREFPYFSSAAITDDTVVFGSRDCRVHCVNRETGKQIWVFRTSGQVDSSPVICGDDILIGSEDGRLYRLRRSNGETKWSYEIGSAILGSPAIASEKLFIGADDGFMYAFGAKQP